MPLPHLRREWDMGASHEMGKVPQTWGVQTLADLTDTRVHLDSTRYTVQNFITHM